MEIDGLPIIHPTLILIVKVNVCSRELPWPTLNGVLRVFAPMKLSLNLVVSMDVNFFEEWSTNPILENNVPRTSLEMTLQYL